MVNPLAALPVHLTLQLISARYAEQHSNATCDIGISFLDQAAAPAPVHVPDGYTVFPDIGIAYKYYSHNLTWDSARKHCIAEGGRLAVIDSGKKFEYANQVLRGNAKGPFVGVHRIFGSDNEVVEWCDAKTGLNLTGSIAWREGADRHDNTTKCGSLHPNGTGVEPSSCDEPGPHICQLLLTAEDEPLPKNIMELPSGYTVFPDHGLAYKFFKIKKTWNEARRYCIAEGGNLPVIDSWEKLQRINELTQEVLEVPVGIHRLFNNTEWIDVKTGSPLVMIPWGIPKLNATPYSMRHASAQCTFVAKTMGHGLFMGLCNVPASFVCEIAISKDVKQSN